MESLSRSCRCEAGTSGAPGIICCRRSEGTISRPRSSQGNSRRRVRTTPSTATCRGSRLPSPFARSQQTTCIAPSKARSFTNSTPSKLTPGLWHTPCGDHQKEVVSHGNPGEGPRHAGRQEREAGRHPEGQAAGEKPDRPRRPGRGGFGRVVPGERPAGVVLTIKDPNDSKDCRDLNLCPCCP